MHTPQFLASSILATHARTRLDLLLLPLLPAGPTWGPLGAAEASCAPSSGWDEPCAEDASAAAAAVVEQGSAAGDAADAPMLDSSETRVALRAGDWQQGSKHQQDTNADQLSSGASRDHQGRMVTLLGSA
jgi:hypothetical protein